MKSKAQYKTIDGKRHKLCRGVLHREGKWVPLDNFYHRPDNGIIRSACIDCDFARKGAERNVEFTQQWWAWVEEIVNRVGTREAMRQIGVCEAWYRWVRKAKPRTMHRATARKIIIALKYLRANEIVRHRDSIHHGAALRGHKEKVPIRRKDLYRPHGDNDTEDKRSRTAISR